MLKLLTFYFKAMKSHTAETYPKLADTVRVVNENDANFGKVGKITKHQKNNDDGIPFFVTFDNACDAWYVGYELEVI